jgi:hypothetical protein
VRSGWEKVKGWARSLTGQDRRQGGLQKASRIIYPHCDLTTRAQGAVQLEDDDYALGGFVYG